MRDSSGWRLILLTIAMPGAALPALANVTYTCDSAFNSFAPAGTCAAMNGSTVSGVYSGIFSNVTASIYVRYYGGGLAGSSFNLNSVSYSSYLAALASHEGDANDVSAVHSLATSEPSLYSGMDVAITSALGTALGLTNSAGIDALGNSCTLGAAGCYDGVITIGGSANPIYFPLSPSDPTGPGWDFFMLAEHETDEILGSISCIGTGSGGTPVNQCTQNANGSGATYVSPADLFRYSAPGTLSFLNNATGGPAYFSIDGGATNIASYVNSPNIGDYGDWAAGCSPARVQNYSACQSSNVDIAGDGGAEVAVLDAVGFNLNTQTTPEPGTWGLLGAGLAFLAFAGGRRR